MSFTPLQIEALRQLFSMSPAVREVTLSGVTSDSGGSLLRRSNSLDQLQSAFATPPPSGRSRTTGLSSHASSDNDSVVSSSSQRIHHKDAPQQLASYLAKNYFSASKVWDHLFNDNNRISTVRLKRILVQLTDRLKPAQRKTLKLHRKKIETMLKKKICAGRQYRQVL